MKPITIQYDGRITVSDYGTFSLGEYAVSDLIRKALRLERNEYREMNAEVTITIHPKSNEPVITGGDDCEC